MPKQPDHRWVPTSSGRKFWLLDPRPEDICIEDIACSLSKLCRFNGATKEFYSVAQHSLLCSELVSEKLAGEAFGHDFAETIIGDVTRGMLNLRNGPTGYDCWLGHLDMSLTQIECHIQIVIAHKFGLQWPPPSEVQQVDDALGATEMRQLTKVPPHEFIGKAKPLRVTIHPVDNEVARAMFLRRYEVLRLEGLIR